MGNLARARRTLTIVLFVLLTVDVVAAIVLLSPLSRGQNAGQQEFNAIRAKVQDKERAVVPPDKMQGRVELARRQIGSFYSSRLPAEFSSITGELGKLAGQDKVKLSAAHYETQDSEVPDLQEVKITANLSGDYVQVVKYINDLERDPLFFVVSNVSLVEQSAGMVRLQVTAVTYLRQT